MITNEPVAYINEEDGLVCAKCYKPFNKELTDEKITAIAKEIFKDYKNFHHYQIDFARAVIKEVSEK
jgi:hypothetical protein